MNGQENKNSILSDYRVLDLTDEKGLLCSKLLANMGADVIRIETSGKTDEYNYLNAGKRNVTLNIDTEQGQEIFKQLACTSDVLVESYQSGYMESLGLGYNTLCSINPLLIMASITGFGQTGPYSTYKSCDLITSAMGGQMYVCGDEDTPPLKPYGNQTHFTACLFAANGIMLALWHRHTTSKGKYIDISIQDCVAATLDHVLVRYLYQNDIAKRQGGLFWNNAFRVFPCSDGYVLLSILYQWETLIELLDSDGMAEDLAESKWRNREFQTEHIDHIIEVMERWTRSHTTAELVEIGQLMHFPWAKVTDIPELLDSPQLKKRDFFIEAVNPQTGKKYKQPGALCKMSRSPWKINTHIPQQGEHNKEIYQDELGLSNTELESLKKKGVI